MSSDTEEFPVVIKEREEGQEDYVLPEILREAEQQEDSSGSEGDDTEEENDSSEEEEEEEEEEDDDASWLTPELDLQILQTIAAIKTRDPKVYDPSTKFYTDDIYDKAKKKEQKKDKKITLKDYEREMLLKHGGRIEEEERTESNDDEPRVLTYDEEQVAIKDEFKQAVFADKEEFEDNGDEDDFLVKRTKTPAEEKKEEEDYKEFILKNLAASFTWHYCKLSSAEAFKDWNNYKDNPSVSSDDAFLIDYVLNRGWIGKEQETPTYEEIVAVDEDEEHLDQVDRFESKYNFRFEEEGSAQIVSHERNPEGSVRRKESKRKRERERKKLKKEKERQEKKAEMERLKAEKIKEIQERLKEIKKSCGDDVLGLENIDLDADFDPKTWDAQMAKVFDDNYYAGGEMEKPVWDDDLDDIPEEEDEEHSGYKRKREYDEEDEDENKRKKIAKTEHSIDNEDTKKRKEMARKEYNKLMDELHSLEFEDIIGGDTPTRYKYRQTAPEDYGLTAEEILMADDKELNKYISLKSLAPYRKPELSERENKMFNKHKKSKYRELRRHLDKKLGGSDKSHGHQKKKWSNNNSSSHNRHWKGKHKA
ncbi:KRRI-Interacting protein 1 [Apophysomyces ossiformis]|uniref:KRRI-Interacting protein 1 n=1 Tax=Apophysomyces ossiformis TaxID=679940 RepID=A0A8H7BPH5_9FUNG|nr:KRRI-Interacting protein 1 [Apophysomyces ossiformis]